MTPMAADVSSIEMSGFTYITSFCLTNINLIAQNVFVNHPKNISIKDLEFTVVTTKKNI